MTKVIFTLIFLSIPFLSFCQSDHLLKISGGINHSLEFKRPYTNAYVASRVVDVHNKPGAFIYIESKKLWLNLSVRSGINVRRFRYGFTQPYFQQITLPHAYNELNISEFSIPLHVGLYIIDKPQLKVYPFAGLSARKIGSATTIVTESGRGKVFDGEARLQIGDRQLFRNLNSGITFHFHHDTRLSLFGEFFY